MTEFAKRQMYVDSIVTQAINGQIPKEKAIEVQKEFEELQSKYKECVIKDYFDNGMKTKQICEKYHITQKLFDDIREPIMRILFSKGTSFGLHNIFDENKELPGFTNFSEEEITWQQKK